MNIQIIMNDLLNEMSDFEYGYLNGTDNLYKGNGKWSSKFDSLYRLQSADELIKSKCGICYDQVEYERSYFLLHKIKTRSFFIISSNEQNTFTHTFIVIEDNKEFYWFENSWDIYKGIHVYSNLKDLLLDVKNKFDKYFNYCSLFTFVYEYDKPKTGISISEFVNYVQNQKLIKLNEPFYFYHLINKDADLSRGILSLQYMFDNKLYNLFDKYTEKYISRITGSWNILKYKDKEKLTREEIMDALNIFRGDYGNSYIYFFRYPPYKELGVNMSKVLDYKDIYRINLGDEELLLNIKDIFWGFEMSNSDNKVLDYDYYRSITEKEYFARYDDNNKMLFSTLNHISIAFVNDKCDGKFITKM